MDRTIYHQVIEPKFEIKIGIKDNKVVRIDWEEMLKYNNWNNIKKDLKDYLKQAIRMIK